MPADSSKLKKRVWIISELYYPEETSTGYFLTKIAEGLAGRYNVNVLCSQPTYSSRGELAPSNETNNGVNIHRCFSTTFNKDVLLLRLINMMTITFSIFVNCLHRFRSGDCVVVVTNPPLLPFPVLVASLLRRSKCCLLIHDVYPEVLKASGITRDNSLAMRSIGWLTQCLYRLVAHIIVLGRDMDALVKERLDTVNQRMCIIPNWADIDFIMPCNRRDNPLINKLGLPDKFVIQYSGNIGRTHGVEQLVNCAEQLQDDSAIHFLFIGFGAKKLWLERQVRERQLSNMTIMDYRPRSELAFSLTACDVAIISFAEGMAGVSVPSRMYNVMAAGKPIIAVADPASELALVVSEEEIGWVVAPGDIAGLCMAIMTARNNPNLLAQMGQRARLAAENKYSFERVRQAYEDMLDSIYKEAG